MHLPYFQRRITEVFPENAAEQFIIGKPVSVQDDIDRILAGDQILINMGQTEFVLVLEL